MSTVDGLPEGSGRYRFERRIATGGMGEVWAAADQVLGREVAIKLLKREYADDATFRSRFETEARNAAALHHANVATVFDFGELPEADGEHGRPFLVMELVRGEPLSALLRSGRPMPADTAANLLAQAADGLAAAHRLGIVHRDVKPANLLVTPERTLKITDFGIARAADAVALTQTGQVVGTPQYFSPEQAQGQAATPASDVYSLGVVLYECLAGRRPFDAASPVATALAHLRDAPPPLPAEIPEQLRRTVEVALAKDPAARFASVADMAIALRGGRVPPTTTPSGSGQSRPGQSRGGQARSGQSPPVGPDQAATQVVAPTGSGAGARPGPGAGPTRVVPAVGDPVRTPVQTPVTRAPDRSGSSARALWITVLVVVLVLGGVLAYIALQGRGEDPRTPAPTPSASPSSTPRSPSATPSPRAVQVDADTYIGLRADEARRRLQGQGLKVAPYQRVENASDHEAGTVADVTPSGKVDAGSTVTLYVYRAAATPSATPTPTPTPSESPTTSPSESPSPSDSPTTSPSESPTEDDDS